MHRRRNLEPSLRAGWPTASHENAVIQVAHHCIAPLWHTHRPPLCLPLGATGIIRIGGRSPLLYEVRCVAPHHARIDPIPAVCRAV